MNDKLKIGILTESHSFSEHEDWKKYMVDKLINDESVEWVKFINIFGLSNKRESKTLSGSILNLQFGLETKISKIYFPSNSEIQIPDIETVEVRDSEELAGILKKQEASGTVSFDVIINLSSQAVAQSFVDLAKYGVWELRYLDENINNIKSFGLSELKNNKPNISIILVNYLPQEIEKRYSANYNIHYSIYRNYTYILYGVTSFLIKNIKSRNEPVTDAVIEKVAEKPGTFDILRYLSNFYKNALLKKASPKTQAFGNYNWGILLGQGSIKDNDLKSLERIDPPEGEFWADPFLLKNNGDLYLFFERFPYSTLRGRISCCKIEHGRATDIKDILNSDYHMSFPYIFREDNEIYIIPETSERKRLEVYRCVNFPDKWELYSTAFDGVSMADTVYYKDKEGQRWLFTSLSHPAIHDHCSELYIYKIDSLRFNKIEPHKQNPVIIDSSLARGGGGIFEEDGKIYRVSQINSYGIYGAGVNINEIKTLTLDRYKEEKKREILYKDVDNAVRIHQLHQLNNLNNLFVMDVCYKKM